jgi:hypothetical protein
LGLLEEDTMFGRRRRVINRHWTQSSPLEDQSHHPMSKLFASSAVDLDDIDHQDYDLDELGNRIKIAHRFHPKDLFDDDRIL